jgi:hypothetical protein
MRKAEKKEGGKLRRWEGESGSRNLEVGKERRWEVEKVGR